MAAIILSFQERLSYSLRVGGWSKIFVPVLLGQIIGALALQRVSWEPFFFGLIQGLLLLFSIIFSNDIADEKVDYIKRQMYPNNSSPKTLTDNLLPRSLVYSLALICPIAFLLLGFYGNSFLNRPYLFIYSLLLILSYAYSWPPLKLNYRMGGELLEAFGIGFCLPCYNAYLQSSLLWHDNFLFFRGFFFIALAHALCSGVSDKNSDVLGGKKTIAVLLGNKSLVLIILIVLFWSLWASLLPYWLLAFIGLVLLASIKNFKSFYNEKIETDILVQKGFRNFLHRVTSWIILLQITYLLYLLVIQYEKTW